MNSLKHLAIIMDGNGRWAEGRNKSRTYGHVKGTRVAKQIITECADLGIQHLTLYAFSSENWLRPAAEVSFLMALLKKYLLRETKNLIKKNIQFTAIGDLKNLPVDVAEAIRVSEKMTSHCTGLKLTFALSYGSRQEITAAFQSLALDIQSGNLKSENITSEMIQSRLLTNTMPDPDLVIRTSGEKRISNFLLWQSAYSEFYFSDVLWPDFTKADLLTALTDYFARDRRFGRVKIKEKQNEHLSN